MKVIRHAAVYTEHGILADGAVGIADGRIAAVGSTASVAAGAEEVDGRGLLLIPGLIDMQCNGLEGYDVLAGDTQALRGLAVALPRYGCTAVLPTIITARLEVTRRCVEAVATVASEPGTGATILGAHMEGPWLSTAHHGAHDPACVRAFDATEFERLLAAARGTLRLVTLAPEAPGNGDAVRRIAAAGVLVSLGHSGATYDEAVAAVALGARMATHCFNAMGALHHRAPGLAGAALDQPDLVPGVIPDGHHVHPTIIRLLARARGPRGLVVVTDSVPAAGLPPGTYAWHGREVTTDGETVRLVDGGGLAGSAVTPIEALRRYMLHTGLPLAEALPSMTSTPARLLGQQGVRGVIAPGARADLVLLTPDIQVRTTFVAGNIVYRA